MRRWGSLEVHGGARSCLLPPSTAPQRTASTRWGSRCHLHLHLCSPSSIKCLSASLLLLLHLAHAPASRPRPFPIPFVCKARVEETHPASSLCACFARPLYLGFAVRSILILDCFKLGDFDVRLRASIERHSRPSQRSSSSVYIATSGCSTSFVSAHNASSTPLQKHENGRNQPLSLSRIFTSIQHNLFSNLVTTSLYVWRFLSESLCDIIQRCFLLRPKSRDPDLHTASYRFSTFHASTTNL